MADNAEDKLIAVARHIAKSIGRTDTMTDDIIQIFSTFDRRFSPEKLARHIRDDNDASSRSEQSLRELDRKLSTYIASTSSIWTESYTSESFLRAVDDLIAIQRDLVPTNRRLVDEADDLLNKSMLRLEEEFTSLILQESGNGSPDASDDEDAINADEDRIVIESLSPGTVSDLYQIAKRMVAGGFGKVCARAYSKARSNSLEESLSRSGVRRWTMEELQGKPWGEVDMEIMRWSRAAKVAFKDVFPGERRLCRRVFADLTAVADLSFFELCRDPALQLMVLPRTVAEGSKAPERLFRMVDVYETLRDSMTEIELVFSDQQCSSVRSESTTVFVGIRIAIRGVFAELENLIRCDPVKDPFPGGGVHPITKYVMNYLRAALVSLPTLVEVMEENGEMSSSLNVEIGWIMEVLLENVEAKSKVYRDPSQSCVFLMNNRHYVIRKVKDTELEQIMGEDWIRRQLASMKRYHNGYQRSTWRNLVDILQPESGEGIGGKNAMTKVMKEKIRKFNVGFDEIWKTQKGWIVTDEQLKAEIRIAAAAIILPAYRSFLVRCSTAILDGGKHMEKNVKYSVEDVEGRINELFQGITKRV